MITSGRRLATRQLDLEETQITGREPDNALAAPTCRGRDFVTERLDLELSRHLGRVPLLEKQAARPGLTEQERLAINQELDAVHAAVRRIDDRLALRQDYLSGARTARQVELADMQASVQAQRDMAVKRLKVVEKEFDRVQGGRRGGVRPPGRKREPWRWNTAVPSCSSISPNSRWRFWIASWRSRLISGQ